MGFSGQEERSGLPLPSPGDFPDPGIKPGSPALEADSLPLSHRGSPKNTYKSVPIPYKKGIFLKIRPIQVIQMFYHTLQMKQNFSLDVLLRKTVKDNRGCKLKRPQGPSTSPNCVKRAW